MNLDNFATAVVALAPILAALAALLALMLFADAWLGREDER